MNCGLVSLAILGLVPVQLEAVRQLSYASGDGRVTLCRVKGSDALFFQSKLSCDVDGSPNAYHPLDDRLALDVIGSAGGRRRADSTSGPLEVLPSPEVVVYKDGTPYVQPDGDYKGFFVSETSCESSGLPATSPNRYLDARQINYIVLPAGLVPEAEVGDLAILYDPYSHRHVAAIFGDIGPSSESGEASLAAIQRLGLPATDGKSSPGQSRDDLLFLVFPHTKFLLSIVEPWPHSQATIDALAESQFVSWGGSDLVEAVLKLRPVGGSVPDTPQNQPIYDELARLRKEKLAKHYAFALPNRYGFDQDGRLPCAPEIREACESAILTIERKIGAMDRSVPNNKALNVLNDHVTTLDAIIRRFPREARNYVAPPDADGQRALMLRN